MAYAASVRAAPRSLWFAVAAWAIVCAQTDPWAARREAMVRNDIAGRGVTHPGVLRVMRTTPRHLFVPLESREQAYNDHPLAIGHGQTISQPYIVAFMTELLEPARSQKVLEIGTGSGYQTAVLSPLVGHVYSIEIVPELARDSAALLAKLGHKNVTVRHGDGYQGWQEHAPFDRIILTAAPPDVPPKLIEQLKPGGKLVAPVGRGFGQQLIVIDKDRAGKLKRREVLPVRFVPMVPGPERKE
jgi:protein-L-isoaspartate(D-aspartate) O-methyltransferase